VTKQVSKLPTFATEKEAAQWFASHNTAPYMDELEKVKEKIPVRRTRPMKKPVDLRLRTDQLDAIKRTAKRRGMPY
jgi:predicted DNA binding CopG/RHH family protein